MKILIFPFPLLAHYSRCYELFKELRSVHEVCVAGDKECCSFLAERGVTAMLCESFDRRAVIEAAQRFDFSWLSKESISRVFQGYVEAIRAFSPDLVVSDAAQVASLACDLTQVPHLAIMNAYMSRWYKGERGIPEQHPAERYKEITPSWLFSRIVSLAEATAMYRVHSPFRALRRSLRLPRRASLLAEQEGDHTCIVDDPTIFPLKRLPESISLLGPVYYGMNANSFRPAPTPTRNPMIVVSMGSSGGWDGLRMLNDPLFSNYSIRCVGACPDYLVAPHITRVPFLSPDELYRDVSAIVCHGGNGTIYQALAHGVPILCRPTFFDQEWNVTQFAQHQLVTRVPRDVTPEGLMQLFEIAVARSKSHHLSYRSPISDQLERVKKAIEMAVKSRIA